MFPKKKFLILSLLSHQDLFNEESNEAMKLNKKLGLSIGAFQGLANIALNGIVLGKEITAL